MSANSLKPLLFGALLALLACSACTLIYKQNIQQGNALEQKDLDELFLGMNKRQVSFLLGSPSIQDPFHKDRWDYVQTFSRRGGAMVKRTITLRFENDLLTEIQGVDDPMYPSTKYDPDDLIKTIPYSVLQARNNPAAPLAPEDEVADEVDAEVATAETGEAAASAAAQAPETLSRVVEPDVIPIGERTTSDREYDEGTPDAQQPAAGDAPPPPDSDG